MNHPLRASRAPSRGHRWRTGGAGSAVSAGWCARCGPRWGWRRVSGPRCPRAQKMAVLAALAPFGARVLDLKMLEPSLEDVFFGFAD